MTRRHARQIKLAEVGRAGQQRIAESVCTVPGQGASAIVEARYLAGAGFGHLVVEDGEVARAAREVDPAIDVALRGVAKEPPPAEPLEPLGGSAASQALEELSPAARDVARGAYRALAEIRARVLL
jgi:hypothetical protein